LEGRAFAKLWDAVRGRGIPGFDQAGLDLAQARFTRVAEDHERREERCRQDSQKFPAYHLGEVLQRELQAGFASVVGAIREQAQARAHAVRSGKRGQKRKVVDKMFMSGGRSGGESAEE
jgi:hypothetical protein